MTRSIYKFTVDCGRSGTLEGVFAAEPEDVAFALGKTVYFDEPFGRHSGVEVTFAADHFETVTSDAGFVALFERLNLSSGACPLGLLHDWVLDGAVTTEEKTVSAYFQDAIDARAKMVAAALKRTERGATQ